MKLPQFQRQFGEEGLRTSARLRAAGAPEVEVEPSPDKLQALLDHVEAVWRRFGETEPHWSVLTNERYRQDQLDAHRAEFYASGEKDADRFFRALARTGIDIGSLKTCLELGSGVGRITLWLARAFEHVVAADISAPHLAEAERALTARGIANVTYRRVARLAELDALPACDAFFSFISLQHSPPPVMRLVLETSLSRLRIGGVGYFQLPTQLVEYRFSVDEFLEGRAAAKDMEHHCLPAPALFALIERAGCRVLECVQDELSRPNKISNTLTVQKIRAAETA